jgi:hypothetical protein
LWSQPTAEVLSPKLKKHSSFLTDDGVLLAIL